MLEQLIHRCISAYILQPLPLDCPNHCCCCLLHPHLPEPNTWINTSAPRPTSALVRILHQSSYIFDNTSISNFRCKRSNPCFFALPATLLLPATTVLAQENQYSLNRTRWWLFSCPSKRSRTFFKWYSITVTFSKHFLHTRSTCLTRKHRLSRRSCQSFGTPFFCKRTKKRTSGPR